MAQLNVERAKKRLEERKGKGRIASSSSATTLKANSNVGSAKKRLGERKVDVASLGTELTNFGSTLENIYSGWTDQDTLKQARASADSIYSRLSSAKEYGVDLGFDVDSVLVAYDTVLGGWDDLAGEYGRYKDADSYAKAVKQSKLAKQFEGMTYDKVQEALKQYEEGSDEYEYLRGYTGYSTLADFDEAIKGLDAKANENMTQARANWKDLLNQGTIPSPAKRDIDARLEQSGFDWLGANPHSKPSTGVTQTGGEDFDWLDTSGVTGGGRSHSGGSGYIPNESIRSELQTKRNQYALDHASEPYMKLMENEDFEEKSKYVGSKGADDAWWQDTSDSTYEFVNNVNGARDSIISSWDKNQAGAPVYTSHPLVQKGLAYMNEDEVRVYNYLYATEGKEKANAFLDEIEVMLTKRATDEQAQSIEKEIDEGGVGTSVAMSALSIPMNIGGGIFGAIDSIGGNPYGYYNQMSNTSSAIRQSVGENIEEGTDWQIGNTNVARFLYDTGMSIGDSALGAVSFGHGLSPIMGMTAYQQKAKELTEAGESEDVIFKTALASGLAETVFEYLSVDKLLKIKNVDGFKRAITETAKQMGIEGSEEVLTELANAWADDFFRGGNSETAKMRDELRNRGFSESEIKTELAKYVGEKIALAGIGGALSGGVMGGVASTNNYLGLRSDGKSIRESERMTEAFEMASLSPKESEAYKAYSAYAKKGVTADNATDAQLGNLSATLQSDAYKTAKSKKATDEERLGAMIRLADDKLHTPKTAEEKAKEQKKKAEEKAVEQRLETLSISKETVVASTGSATQIEGIKTEGDETVIVTSEGEVKASEMNFSQTDAELVAYAEGMSDEKANLFLAQYDGKSKVSDYANSFEMAYTYGETGFGADNVFRHKGVLSEAQAVEIYKAGMTNKAKALQINVDNITAKYDGGEFIKGEFNDSIISYNETAKEGQVRYKDLTSTQKRMVRFMKAFSKATGVKINLVKSEVVDGKYKGKQGSYNPETNSIDIDIYAGRMKVGDTTNAIASVLSHELTHWMKAKSPALYAEMQEIAMSNIGSKYNADGYVEFEKRRLDKEHGEGHTDADAIDEIVARTCEDMLSNSKTARELLSKLSPKEQKALVGKAKAYIDNVIAWVDELLGAYPAGSEEAKLLRENKEAFEKMSAMWDKALEEAVKANQSLQKEGITGEKVQSRMSDRNSASEYQKPITMEDVQSLRGIGRKSVNQFTSEDIQKSQKWAYKFYQELGVKSPFFRAWFGDWRAFDTSPLTVVRLDKNAVSAKGNAVNRDTGRKLSWNSEMAKESMLNAPKEYKEDISLISANMPLIVENAILLDTVVSDNSSKRKLEGTSWMHNMYVIVHDGSKHSLVKLFAEEAFSEKQGLTFTRAYSLKYIKKVAEFDDGVLSQKGGLTDSHSTTTYSISDLFELVKQYDERFSPIDVNPALLNDDGTPKTFYHGTDSYEKFNIFKKGKSGYLGGGIYFTSDRNYAERYAKSYGGEGRVYEGYLKVTNPLVVTTNNPATEILGEKVAKRREAKNSFPTSWITSADIKKLQDKGYDGIIWEFGGSQEVSVWNSAQFKSATDNIGTFDGTNPDIRYSDREVRTLTDDDYSKLKNHFGTTNNFVVAGYMLKDGAMLDFSGKHWGDTTSRTRQVDHRDVWDVWENTDFDGTDEMVNMISNGNIRLMAETGGINLAKLPTEAQRKTLTGYINHFKGEVIVDIDRIGGDTVQSFQYDRGTSADKIFADIENYFRGGRQSDLMRFHTQYSDRDSQGNALSENQREFFKDSTIRDAQGRLLVMYHGSPNMFTVFDKKKAKSMGYYGNGFYFTASESHAGQYGNAYRVYLNVKKPVQVGTKDITKSQLKAFVSAIAENEDYGLDNYGYGATVESVVNSLWGKEDFDIFQDLNATCIGNFTEAVEFFNEVCGTNYDGIIAPTETVVFESNQIKSVDNVNPTEHKDIRYSDRDNVSLYETIGEDGRLAEENAKLAEDIAKLASAISGDAVSIKRFRSLADYLKKLAGSNVSREMLGDELKELYEYIQSTPDIQWNNVMAKSYDIARDIMNVFPDVTPNYFKSVMADIRKDKVTLSPSQNSEAVKMFGNYSDFHKRMFGRINIVNEGTPLTEMWSKWSQKYPSIFDANLTETEQIKALVDILDALKTTSSLMREYEREEAIRHLATEVYNQFWNIASDTSEDVKKQRADHRKLMEDLRKAYEARQKESTLHPAGEVALKYEQLLRKVKESDTKEKAKIKELGKQRMTDYKDRVARNAKIEKITKKALTLNQWLLKNSKEEHIPEVMKEPVAYLLSAIDFSSKQLLGMRGGSKANTPTKKDISLSKALEKVHDMVKGINDAQIGEDDISTIYGTFADFPVGFADDVKLLSGVANDLLRQAGDNAFILNEMTLEQLEEFDRIITTLKTTVTKMNKFLAIRHAEGVANMSQQDIVYLDSLGKRKTYDGKIGGADKMLQWGNATPYYAFKRFGEGGKKVMDAIMNGWDKYSFHVRDIIDYTEQTYTSKEAKEWAEDIKEFDILVPPTEAERESKDYEPQYQKVQMSVPQIMALYCTVKRAQAKTHLFGGGMRVADIKGKNGVISQPDGAILTESELEKITGTLTDRQREVADALQRFMNTTCSDWGNDVSMLRFGIKQFGEENYFPIQSDRNNLAVDDETERNNSLFRLLNMSFTKSLTEGANNRIIISDIFDVFAQHTSDMAKYNALALPILDAFKWYNYKEKVKRGKDTQFTTMSLKQSLETAFGKDAQSYITTFLKDINGAESGGRDSVGGGFFTNAKIASVGFNARVIALQPTSYVRANAVIDPKYLTKAFMRKPNIKMAEQYCGIALWKSLGFFDINIQKSVTTIIKHDQTTKDKLVEASMKGAEKADKLTWGYLWNACEIEVREKNPNLVGEELYQKVGLRLREVIYSTQVVDSTVTRSQMMRSKDGRDKMITAFMSEPTLAYNMLQDTYYDWKLTERQTGSKEKAFKKHGKKMARVFLAYTVTNMLSAVVEAGFDFLRDTDDEEITFEDFMKQWGKNLGSNMSILGKIPYGKEIVSFLEGYSSSRTDTQWMQYIASFGSGIVKLFEGKGNAYKTAKDGLKAFSYFTGLPLYNAWRDLTAFGDKVGFEVEELEEMFNDTIGSIFPSLKSK